MSKQIKAKKSAWQKKPLHKRIGIILAHVVLALFAFLWLIPIFWVILTSFRATKGSYSSTFIPTAFSLDNYIKLFTDFSVFNFPQMLLNTLIVAAATCVLSTFFVISVAYTLSRLRFKARKPLMNVAMIINLFPGFMSMIANYYIFKMLGWTNGPLLRLAMIAVYSGGAGLGYHIAKGFFDTIPIALDEAAMLDGCGTWGIFFRIIVPLMKPAVATVGIYTFLQCWNELMFANVFINSDKWRTLPVGVQSLSGQYTTDWGPIGAALSIATIPTLIFYIFMSKKIQDSFVAGAVKG